MDIFDYTNTNKNKIVTGITGGLLSQIQSGSWKSTSAVNSITIIPNIGTNLVAGTRVAVYGIRG